MKPEGRPLAVPALDPDPAAVRLDQPLGDRQPDPRAGHVAGRVAAVELLEEWRQHAPARCPAQCPARRARSRPTRRAEIVIAVPGGVYLIAFSTRFISTWAIST